MSRQKNIKIQLHQKVDSLLCIGQSRHQAKADYRQYCKENNIKITTIKLPGIYSTSSADTIRQSINNFSTWLKNERPDVWNTKNLDNITKEVAYEYLKYQDSVNSPWTVSTRMSSLNKVLHLNLSKKEGNLSQRKLSKITRSRNITASDNKYNPKNYKEGLLIASSFGVRSESLIDGNYKIKDISIFKNQGKVYLSVIEKGGRYRNIPCLQANQREVLETFDVAERDLLSKEDYQKLYSSSNNYLIDKYTTHIDNHAIRAEYAANYYEEVLDKYNIVDEKTYRGYCKPAILEVSKALGHNRASVVVNHYLYKT